VGGQLHAPAALPPWKEPVLLMDTRRLSFIFVHVH